MEHFRNTLLTIIWLGTCFFVVTSCVQETKTIEDGRGYIVERVALPGSIVAINDEIIILEIIPYWRSVLPYDAVKVDIPSFFKEDISRFHPGDYVILHTSHIIYHPGRVSFNCTLYSIDPLLYYGEDFRLDRKEFIYEKTTFPIETAGWYYTHNVNASD